MRLLRSWMMLGAMALGAMWGQSVWGLKPEEVAVIVNVKSAASQQVAQHYAAARGIPAANILTVNIDPADEMSEFLYRQRLVAVLRNDLRERKLDQQIRCLVTTYDIPLRISAQPQTPAEKTQAAALHTEYDSILDEMQDAIAKYDAILPPPPPPPTSMPATTMESATASVPATNAATATGPATAKAPARMALPKLMPALLNAVNAAGKRLNAAPPGDEKKIAAQQYLSLQHRMLGQAGMVSTFHLLHGQTNTETVETTLKTLAEQVRKADERITQLLSDPATPETRTEVLKLMVEAHGLTTAVNYLEATMEQLTHAQSEAAVDNELMLLWNDDYSKTRWLSNPMNLEQSMSRVPAKDKLRVLMVSRLDGATPQKVIEMIDTTIKTEQSGLEGKVYFDARGNHSTDAYAQYDSDIRRAATYLRDNTGLKVMLDDTPQLLQAKECPEGALYCGWYSLRNFQDSVRFVPGAVGYHVASCECVNLHNPQEKGWCVNLLNQGVCGTLGAVSEPYLHSFPKPTLFFPLLLSGRYTLGEVYYLTTPLVSWRITLLGDPLYNPYKAKPRLTEEQLKAHPILRQAERVLREEK